MNVNMTFVWPPWIPQLVFEGAIFLLALFKVFQTAREEGQPPRVLAVILRDSLVYFGGTLVIIILFLVLERLEAPDGRTAAIVMIPKL